MRRALTIVAAIALAGCAGRRGGEAIGVREPVVDSARLVFVGDVMSHTPQVAAARTSGGGYDYTGVFRHFRPIFEGAHVAVANLETTLRTRPPYTGYPSFAAPAELAFDLRRAGIDIVTTANNHICDKGAAGIRSTLAILDSAGIRHTGAFLDSADRRARHPLRFSAGGLKFALLAYTYGTNGIPVPRGMIVNPIDTAVIARDLAGLRRAPGDPTEADPTGIDVVIVSYHWGEEYRPQPTREQRRIAEWTRARGADLVIGGHPHVVEPIEAHLDADSTDVTGATFFSLGNFVSNQIRRHCDGGIAADITLVRRDSLPLRWDVGWRLAWVHTPWRGGVRRYEVMPAPALDTLPAAAAVFAADTRKLLLGEVGDRVRETGSIPVPSSRTTARAVRHTEVP
ncbi:MAG: CapA family protein [Alistipes sp.]|jgi:poly-gamma-glutamate synthesis protein (capsule biosynthesis protein)|nr:CapA family protein [Alistipes sp.]